MIVLLDTGPLGLITNPRASPEPEECRAWFTQLTVSEHSIVIPEICDYELRRELIRVRRRTGLDRLDQLREVADFMELNSDIMLRAAQYWARARRSGHPTAHHHALDADMILAAKAWWAQDGNNDVVVATTNPRHLSNFVEAELWQNINPGP